MGRTFGAETSPLPRAHEAKTLHPLNRSKIISPEASASSMSCIHDDPFPSSLLQHVVECAVPVIEVVVAADQDIGIRIDPDASLQLSDFLTMRASARPEGLRLHDHQG